MANKNRAEEASSTKIMSNVGKNKKKYTASCVRCRRTYKKNRNCSGLDILQEEEAAGGHRICCEPKLMR